MWEREREREREQDWLHKILLFIAAIYFHSFCHDVMNNKKNKNNNAYNNKFFFQVATGRAPELVVFGNDYPTVDGTGVRDHLYIVFYILYFMYYICFMICFLVCLATTSPPWTGRGWDHLHVMILFMYYWFLCYSFVFWRVGRRAGRGWQVIYLGDQII